MDQLRNLQNIYNLASSRFSEYSGEDFVLPQIFKDRVKEINSSLITYNKYSAVIETRGNQNGVLNIYMPNQWFYIASYFTDFYNELQKYKKYALKAITKEKLKDLNGSSLSITERNAIDQLDLDDQSKQYLIKFITDYSWWYGAKTIDRGDFYVSPILNSAKLVNASQSFVADLCAFLADKDELVKAIICGEDNASEIIKKELLRQKAAATFMKKAMKITIDRDPSLIHLAALNQYKKTSKQLLINGFYLGRDKDQLPTRLDDVDTSVSWTYDSLEYVLYLEWTPETMEERFFPVYNKAYQCHLLMQKENDEYVLYELSITKRGNNRKDNKLHQQIFYGAPGTGKSHKIKEDVNVKEANEKNLVFRTTFHPDSDYSTFVGAYKPTIKPVADKYKAVAGKDEEITYSFVPQAFLQAYVAAWNNPEENVYLVIEEINRGNCAQIFGDLFQLLDRDSDGFSEYPIMADNDLKKYLNGKDEEEKDVLTNKDGIKDGKLRLPKNLYIWATMNTSDQSLFPIDSAFKRRWDWVYVPIDTAKETWYIKIEDSYYSWTKFLDKVNDELLTDETAEDKHLGFYFCKATEKKDGTESDPNVITAETFVGKVLFYLWNDVFKVYGIPSSIGSSKDWPYHKFYKTDGKVNMEIVAELMAKLKIAPEGGNENKEEEAKDQ